ncbi:MAG: metalloregulator ArsR/SmtB family transcription factor [Treponema sp.]|nr:metalloregulator ArsR/SmtB family transcription factor [Treponema sp.]MCI6891656.1 metalloregulator ArsR/SmtB family transcription factor [Treponema sp.]
MGQSETCSDVDVIHADIVDKVKKDFPSNQLINTLSDFFKIFGDTTRVKIMCALDKSEMCVGDISVLLDMTVSAVSHQLKILREASLVKTKRQGKIVFYSLADEHVQRIIECGIEHIIEKESE